MMLTVSVLLHFKKLISQKVHSYTGMNYMTVFKLFSQKFLEPLRSWISDFNHDTTITGICTNKVGAFVISSRRMGCLLE